MAVIPPDAGISLRLQNQTSLLPVAPVKPVGLDMPTLQTGQGFTARILEVLPENTYRALIAGREMTLSLPQGAASGDTLELVVIDRTPKLILAQIANQPEATTAQLNQNTTLSQAGRLISSLLQMQGDAAPAAPLTRGQPLLTQPPLTGADLASQLGKTVAQSGLFYESHQAQWIAGRLPLQQLMQEPQGQQLAAAVNTGRNTVAATNELVNPRVPEQPGNAVPTQILPHSEASAASANTATAGRPEQAAGNTAAQAQSISRGEQGSTQPQTIPDALRPLVQQQLDAVVTQRLAWHGEVWPGQNMEWAIQWEQSPREGRKTDEDREAWSTTVSLTTPRLGKVDATLQLAANGVRIVLATSVGASAADLRDGGPILAANLSAAGVPLLAMQVKHEEE